MTQKLSSHVRELAARRLNKQKEKPRDVFSRLRDAWEKVNLANENDVKSAYLTILGVLGGIRCSALEIEIFSRAVEDFPVETKLGMKRGLFIAALINGSTDDEFRIHSSEGCPLEYVGYLNTSSIVVDGPAGEGLADRMLSGSLKINGKVPRIGKATGGEVKVYSECPPEISEQSEASVYHNDNLMHGGPKVKTA